jgi:hypothetical protein
MKEPDDYQLSIQGVAYRVAKHFGCTMTDVMNMDYEDVVMHVSWAISMDEMRAEKARDAKASGESINVDYSQHLMEGMW